MSLPGAETVEVYSHCEELALIHEAAEEERGQESEFAVRLLTAIGGVKKGEALFPYILVGDDARFAIAAFEKAKESPDSQWCELAEARDNVVGDFIYAAA